MIQPIKGQGNIKKDEKKSKEAPVPDKPKDIIRQSHLIERFDPKANDDDGNVC